MNKVNEMREPFYLVWREDGDAPTTKHFTSESAETEAARLAKRFPGRTFHVLLVTKSAVVHPVTWIGYIDFDESVLP